jgi:hypothetical protein
VNNLPSIWILDLPLHFSDMREKISYLQREELPIFFCGIRFGQEQSSLLDVCQQECDQDLIVQPILARWPTFLPQSYHA